MVNEHSDGEIVNVLRLAARDLLYASSDRILHATSQQIHSCQHLKE